jgi:hypothetical protein
MSSYAKNKFRQIHLIFNGLRVSVVVAFVLAQELFEVAFSENDKIIEALELDRLNETLGTCVKVGGGERNAFHPHAGGFKNLSNAVVGEVPASSLQLPPGWEKIKGVLGQRQIKN